MPNHHYISSVLGLGAEITPSSKNYTSGKGLTSDVTLMIFYHMTMCACTVPNKKISVDLVDSLVCFPFHTLYALYVYVA